MSELLFEIFCEEIPARMQPKAEADLERLLGEKLTAAGLAWSSLTTFAGPRRLGLAIDGLPVKTEDVREERKGPRVGAPDKAVEGFLRGAGVDSLDACEKREDKKGEFWVAIIEKPGRATAEVIAEAIPEVMKAFPWPKSMKFGEDGKAQRWVRPIQRLLCLFDGQVVDFEVYGITTGNLTEGHRRMGRGPFEITDFAQYTQVLREDGHVIQQRAEREAIILDGARTVCREAGLELVEDPGLLTEVAGLVEWPVPLLGEMDPDFLDLPPEVITLTMKTHQKYFAVKKPGETGVTSKFVVIANQVAPDGGQAIAAGNARVLSARLSDARHFWDNDRKTPLYDETGQRPDMYSQLSKVTFHEKLGTVADKVERVAALARELAPVVGADADLAEKAARRAKADLVSEMVYEFPELQGAMGRYYALDQREDAAVADAIKDHYKPQGPSDEVPTAPVSAAVALADKLDTLVGFWAIDEKPTGSKDPFALRRAALGVIRILLNCGRKLEIKRISNIALALHFARGDSLPWDKFVDEMREWIDEVYPSTELVQQIGAGPWRLLFEQGDLLEWAIPLLRQTADFEDWSEWSEEHDEARRELRGRIDDLRYLQALTDVPNEQTIRIAKALKTETDQSKNRLRAGEVANWRGGESLSSDLLAFFADRLKVHLRDEGIRYDVIDAVFAPDHMGTVDDDLVRVAKRARALQSFLDSVDGDALLQGYRRASRLLEQAEQSGFDAKAEGDRVFPRGDSISDKLSVLEERATAHEEKMLAATLRVNLPNAVGAASNEDFGSAMMSFVAVRNAIYEFFENVVVNAENDAEKTNRLLLLSVFRQCTQTVADLSKISG